MLKLLGVLALAIIVMVGCATTDPGQLKKMSDNQLLDSRLWAQDQTNYRKEMVSRHPEWKEDVKKTILEGKLQIGMTMDQVLASWGKPTNTTKSGSVFGTSEMWIYGDFQYTSKVTYLYFGGDTLTSFSQT